MPVQNVHRHAWNAWYCVCPNLMWLQEKTASPYSMNVPASVRKQLLLCRWTPSMPWNCVSFAKLYAMNVPKNVVCFRTNTVKYVLMNAVLVQVNVVQ